MNAKRFSASLASSKAMMATDLPRPGLIERARRIVRQWRFAYWSERLYPFAAGAAAVACVASLEITEEQFAALIENVLPVAVSVAAILAGFQATAQTILLAIVGSETIAFMKRTGHYELIVRYLWAALLSLFVFVAVALVLLFLDALGFQLQKHRLCLTGGLSAVLAFAGAASYRITRVMVRVLRLKS